MCRTVTCDGPRGAGRIGNCDAGGQAAAKKIMHDLPGHLFLAAEEMRSQLCPAVANRDRPAPPIRPVGYSALKRSQAEKRVCFPSLDRGTWAWGVFPFRRGPVWGGCGERFASRTHSMRRIVVFQEDRALAGCSLSATEDFNAPSPPGRRKISWDGFDRDRFDPEPHVAPRRLLPRGRGADAESQARRRAPRPTAGGGKPGR